MRTAALLAAALALPGCCAFSAPGYVGPVSDHFDGKRFRNLAAFPERDFLDFLRWRLTRDPEPWSAWTDAPPGPKPPERAGAGELRATFVGHSTVLIQMDGVNVLTDPIWSDRASPVSWAGPRRVRPAGVRFEDLPPLDAAVVSHNHYDHLDLPTLARIAAERPAPIYVGLGNAALLERAGVSGARELDWWQEAPLSETVTLTMVPAQHWSGRGLCDRRRTLWGGYVLSGPSGAVYFAGCTGWGPHFAEIRRRFGPLRLAMLPIGAYEPRWFMQGQHLSPEETILAAEVLEARTAMGIHFGTFALGDDGEREGADAALAAARAAGNPGPNFWALGFGEGRDVPAAEGTR